MFRTTKQGLAAVAAVAVLAACGGADEPEGTEGANEATAASGAEQTSETNESAEAEGETAEAGGQVTLGERTWEFVPAIQCSIHSGGEVVSIAGHAAGEPDREIVFDVFESGDVQLRISGDEDMMSDWMSVDIDAEVDADARTVSGTASMEYGAETTEADFQFDC